MSEAWKREPHDPLPEGRAIQPLIEVAEVLDSELDPTFEAASQYDATHGAGHPGLTRLYAMERA